MNRRIMVVALVVASTACSSTNKDVAIRSVNSEAVTAAQGAVARGDLLFARGDHALALDAYRRAIRQDPADAHALNGVAISYAAMGRHDLAREYFELALAHAPQDGRIYRNFARSLTAQGRKGEAEALLAQMSSGGDRPSALATRPTLAQLAARGTAAPVKSAMLNVGLERMSMGEVRLRTAAGDQAAVPGRMLPQLTTAIVTVGEGAGAIPAPSLTRELKAPIIVAGAPAAGAAPLRNATPKAKPRMKMASAKPDCTIEDRESGGFRLPATGYSISLATPTREDSTACANMAGTDETDGLFEKLWQWSGRRG